MGLINTTSVLVPAYGGSLPTSLPPTKINLLSAFDIAEADARRSDNSVRSAIEAHLKSDANFKQLHANRSLLKDSPGFSFYRKSENSRLIHAAAGSGIVTGKLAKKIACLDSEIACSRTTLLKGQVLFHGTHSKSQSALIGSALPSYFSTTLCVSVANWHARKAAKYNLQNGHFTFIPMIIEIRLAQDIPVFLRREIFQNLRFFSKGD